jgi:3-methyladenine DNA glycosylase AlkD
MTAAETIDELRALGTAPYKKILLNHGIPEPVFGVKVADLQKIRKRVRKDYRLALDLYDSGVYDAMYLAGLVADEAKMTRKDLNRWAARATSDAICGSAVAWVAAESRHGWDLALGWIESNNQRVATAGWETLSCLVALKEDVDLDVPRLKELLRHAEKTIHRQPNRVRSCMNGFVISVGCYVEPLTALAAKTAKKIGVVSVDVGNTACKVPFAPDYIEKVRRMGRVGKKRKTVRC